MATNTLLDKEIDAGQKLIDALIRSDVSIITALWLYTLENRSWHLVIATPMYDKLGPLKTYNSILSTYRQVMPESGVIDWTAIRAIGAKDELTQGLLSGGYGNYSGRFSTMLPTKVWVDDGYIYQITTV